jgi:hypothetical protein
MPEAPPVEPEEPPNEEPAPETPPSLWCPNPTKSQPHVGPASPSTLNADRHPPPIHERRWVRAKAPLAAWDSQLAAGVEARPLLEHEVAHRPPAPGLDVGAAVAVAGLCGVQIEMRTASSPCSAYST